MSPWANKYENNHCVVNFAFFLSAVQYYMYKIAVSEKSHIEFSSVDETSIEPHIRLWWACKFLAQNEAKPSYKLYIRADSVLKTDRFKINVRYKRTTITFELLISITWSSRKLYCPIYYYLSSNFNHDLVKTNDIGCNVFSIIGCRNSLT